MERVAAQIAGSVAGSLLREIETELSTEHAVLAEIGTLMGAATDLNAVWPEFSEQLDKILDFDRVLLLSINSEAQLATVICDRSKSLQDSKMPQAGDNFDLKGTIADHVVITRGTFSFEGNNSEALAEQFPGSFVGTTGLPWKANVAIPLIWGGNVVAALFFHGHSADGYTSAEVDLAERIAAQIAGSVAGSLLRKTESEVEAQRDALERVISLLGSAEDINEVWNEFGTIVSEILEFDRCVVLAIEQDTGKAGVLYDTIPENLRGREYGLVGADVSYDLDGTVAGQIAEDRESVILNQTKPNQLLERYEGLAQQGFKLPFLSNMGVPLISGDKVVACLFFGSRAVNTYGDHELAIAERITAQISGPIAGSIVRQRDIELADEHSLRVAAEMETAVLAELSETKSNFIGAMSHELKTPLTSIVAFADILSRSNEKGLDGRPLQQIKVIQRNARHLEGMINELLDLSRMESGRFEILKSPFDFAGIVAEAIESSQPQLEGMGQEVDFQISVDVLLVNGDRERLFQVMTNLLSNASKYSPNDSKIEIEVKEDERWLIVEVRDRGPGVPDDDPEALFAMFGRADNEITRRVAGTGIGLHVSKRIIDEHGGQITIKSRDDGGAVARFRIPLGVNAIG
jgi:signal transduction histidine kinase